jgi:beta-N-acetylhexosaminidase
MRERRAEHRPVSAHEWQPETRRRLPVAGLLLGLLALAACGATATGSPAAARSEIAHVPLPPLLTQLGPDARALQMVGRMSLDDKLGQLIVIQYTDTNYTAQQAALVQPFHPGGVILYGYAMGSAQQARDLVAGGQHDSPIPMFVFTDLEGGVVDRLAESGYLPPRMGAPDMAATGDPRVAEQQGKQTARDLLSFGINADLAPDVDVAVVAGPDQWGRTFGSTPGPVTTFAGAWLQGLQSQGVVGSLKHFPGLGAATTDAHTDLPVIDRSRADLEATELAPYRALIATGQVHMIMSTDVLMPALDPTMPAEISNAIITGVLRNELHYDGVAITDALYMAGITDHYSFTQAAVLAIEAGNDMIMAPWQPYMVQGIIDGLKQALANGSLTMQQVDNSVRRILAVKMLYHLLPGPAPLGPQLRDIASADADADLPRPGLRVPLAV